MADKSPKRDMQLSVQPLNDIPKKRHIESMKGKRPDPDEMVNVNLVDDDSSIGFSIAQSPDLPKKDRTIRLRPPSALSASSANSMSRSVSQTVSHIQVPGSSSPAAKQPPSPRVVNQVIDFKQLNQKQNTQMSKVLTHSLIEQVTQSINQVNFMGQEAQIKELILTLLKEPLTKMSLQENLLSKFAEALRRNIRRTHEIEHTVEKYQRAQTFADTFEERFCDLEKKMKLHATIYDDEFVKFKRQLNEDVPDQIRQQNKELESWKRWFVRIQREFETLTEKQKNDNNKLVVSMRTHVNSTMRNLDELLKNQTSLDKDGVFVKAQVKDINEILQDLEVRLEISKKNISRHKGDIDTDMDDLRERIRKAEEDRMDKYYKQVGILQDWVAKNRDAIDDNIKMVEGLSVYFNQENIIQVQNQIAEVMLKVLEGTSFNSFVDFMKEKQDQVGRRRLGMLTNSVKDRVFIAARYLSQKQPFYPMPIKIPDSDLPPDMSTFKTLLSQLETRIIKRVSLMSFSAPPHADSETNRSQRARTSDRRSEGRSRRKNSKKSLKQASPEHLAVFENALKKDRKKKKSRKGHSSASSKLKSSKKDTEGQDDQIIQDSPPNLLNINKIKSPDIKFKQSNTRQQRRRSTSSRASFSHQSRLSDMSSQAKLQTESRSRKTVGFGTVLNKTQSVLKKREITNLSEKGDRKSQTKQIRIIEPNKCDDASDSPSYSDDRQDDKRLNRGVLDMKKIKSVPPKLRSKVNDQNATMDGRESHRQIIGVKNQPQYPMTTRSDDNHSLKHLKATSVSHRSSGASSYSRKDLQHLIDKKGNLFDQKEKQRSKEISIENQADQKQDASSSSQSCTCKSESSSSSKKLAKKSKKKEPEIQKKSTIGSAFMRKQTFIRNANIKSLKSKASAISSSNGLGNSGDSDSDSASSFSSSSDGKPKKINKRGIRNIFDDLREEQREEDEMYFATKTEMEDQKMKMDETALDVTGLIRSTNDTEKYFHQKHKDSAGRIDSLFQQLLGQQKQINENDVKYGKNEICLNESMVALEKRFKAKLQDQFDDFCLKIEGELTRRSRLRVEAFARFKEHEDQIKAMQSEIVRFESNQVAMIGSIKKLMYTNDIQVALNIQDELDREWISLFSGVDERTGLKSFDVKNGSTNDVSKFTLHPDCVSCTGNMQSKISLFKVACLNYSSNPVVYQDSLHQRRELLSLQRVIQDMSKKLVESLKSIGDANPITVASEALQQISPDFSPERTGTQQLTPAETGIGAQNQQQAPMQVLTQSAMDRAKSLLGELVFKDLDLNNQSHIQAKQKDIYRDIFGKIKGSAAKERVKSSYKRKQTRSRPRSMLSTILGSAVEDVYSQANVAMQSMNTEMDSKLDKSSQSIMNFNGVGQYENNYMSHAVMGQERKVTIPMAVMEIGSEILPADSNLQSLGSLPHNRLNPTFALKSRLLQPIVTKVIVGQQTVTDKHAFIHQKQNSVPLSKPSSRQSSRGGGARGMRRPMNQTMEFQNYASNGGNRTINIPRNKKGEGASSKHVVNTEEQRPTGQSGDESEFAFEKIPHDNDTERHLTKTGEVIVAGANGGKKDSSMKVAMITSSDTVTETKK